jgi:hypothetical protein
MLMKGWPLVYRHHAFWRRWMVYQAAEGAAFVVMLPPDFGQDLGL